MPCYFPLQGFFIYEMKNGVKKRRFVVSKSMNAAFRSGTVIPKFNEDGSENGAVPCGKCQGCRLEYSRQWAVRCIHEASLWRDNCFITLTYAEEHLPEGGTLVKKHFVDFMKRLREKYRPQNVDFDPDVHAIRFYMCGEYGDKNLRPHYHALLFNHDFIDKKLVSVSKSGCNVYSSDELQSLWKYGLVAIGDVNFKSAAYTARYVMKKINGDAAEEHYNGRVPEYCNMSRDPGIASGWYDKFKTDMFKGYLTLDSRKIKPPRFYENKFSEQFPVVADIISVSRNAEILAKHEDNSYARLQARLAVKKRSFEKLVRDL